MKLFDEETLELPGGTSTKWSQLPHHRRLRRQPPLSGTPQFDMSKIEWEKRAEFVIKSAYERGNQTEQYEIDRFYETEKVSEVIDGLPRTPLGNIFHASFEQ